jgi:macrolide transport system ATP-binding/permease protein
MSTWFRRLLYWLRQSRHDRELREEIEAHRSLRAAHLERDGMTSQHADAESRRAIGNVLLAREDVRELWLGSWPTFWQDLRYGMRSLRKNALFTTVAVVTLALGIGINTGIFTVLNGVLFRDLPVPAAHEIVSIGQTVEGGQFSATSGTDTFTISEYHAYRDRAQTLSGVLAHSDPRETTLGGETPQEVFGAIVSCNYFTVLQQAPSLGRALIEQDCVPGAPPVVVLGHAIWTTTFAADPGIVGRDIELDRRRFTVIGVAADGTYGGAPMRVAYFAPLSAEPLLWPGESRFRDETFRWLHLIGRRGEGQGLEHVRAELGVIAAQIDRQQPPRETRLTIERATRATVPSGVRGVATGAAAVLMAAFGLVLLIACANVANLLLARGTARSQEIAIRLSLGASRGRVVRQLLTESLLISIAGGLLGSVLALWSFQTLVALALPAAVPPEIPAVAFDLDFSPDNRVLAFALLLTLGTSLLFGLMPALQVSRPDLSGVIKQETAGAGTSRRSGRLRGTLVGVQVALSMVLTISTGLLLRGLYATYTIDPGFAYHNVAFLSFGTDFGPATVVNQRLMDQVAALPGVDAVAFAAQTPLGESMMGGGVRLPGETKEQQRFAEFDQVTPGYFALLDIAIVRGRTFTDAESANAQREGGTRPVIISDTAARTFFGDGDPIGRTLLQDDMRGGETTLEIVGVAADAQLTSLGSIVPYIYMPGGPGGVLLVRSRGSFAAIASGIRALVRASDSSVAFRVLPLEANVAWFRGVSGLVTTLGAGLGVLALVLASVGIYGVVSFGVNRRYREIGIRMALGATARDVLGTILRQAMRPVVIGGVIGIVLAVAVSRVLSSVLFGVSPADPIGLGGSALLVIGVALLAGTIAARPAMRADPTVALRYE